MAAPPPGSSALCTSPRRRPFLDPRRLGAAGSRSSRSCAIERPDELENHLRLAEAYLALGDPEPATTSLCRCRDAREALRRDERVLLDRLLEQAAPLHCAAQIDVDVAAPGD